MGVASTERDVLAVSDRDRILQAMADCCAERGYRSTTVDAVCRRAAVDRESFDLLFAGREDCALAALNKIVSETLARISMIDSGESLALERRTFEIRAVLELLADRPSFAKLAAIDARQGGSDRMHSAYESAARVLALMLERVGAGAMGVGERMAARAAIGGAEALMRRELAVGGMGDLPRLLPDLVYASLVPFVGQGEALRQANLAAKLVAKEG